MPMEPAKAANDEEDDMHPVPAKVVSVGSIKSSYYYTLQSSSRHSYYLAVGLQCLRSTA